MRETRLFVEVVNLFITMFMILFLNHTLGSYKSQKQMTEVHVRIKA